jgi:hypothetical protein
MREMGIGGARRGCKIRTTIRDAGHERAADLLRRDFTAPAPNRRWVADFTYVAAWAGIVYVAFVVDVYSRVIVGWAAASHKRAKLVLDAPARRCGGVTGPGTRPGLAWCITVTPGRWAVHLFRVHRSPSRRRDRRLYRHRRGRPRRRAHGVRNRPVQDRADEKTRTVAQPC